MQGKERSRRRGVRMDVKRRISAVLSVMLTTAMTLNMPLGVLGGGAMEAFASTGDTKPASVSDAEKKEPSAPDNGYKGAEDMEEGWMTAKNAEYQPGARQDVDIYVIAEDNDIAPGNVSTMRLYLKNNTGDVVTDGVLSFTGSRIKKEDGTFTDISGSGVVTAAGELDDWGGTGAMDGDGSALDEERLDELEALEAEAYAREFGKDEDGQGLDKLTGLCLEPGQLHEIEFTFYTDDDARDGKAYVNFKFQGEGSEGKLRSEEKFYYSIGLPSVNIELADGQALETGVEHELTIWMSAPSWGDYEIEETGAPVKKTGAATQAEETKAQAEEDKAQEEPTDQEEAAGGESQAAQAGEGTRAEETGAEETGAEETGAEETGAEETGAEGETAAFAADSQRTGQSGTETDTEAGVKEDTEAGTAAQDEGAEKGIEEAAKEEDGGQTIDRSPLEPETAYAPLAQVADTTALEAEPKAAQEEGILEETAVEETTAAETIKGAAPEEALAEAPSETAAPKETDAEAERQEPSAQPDQKGTSAPAEETLPAETSAPAEQETRAASASLESSAGSVEADAVLESSTAAPVQGTTAVAESIEEEEERKAREEAAAKEAEQAAQIQAAMAIEESKVSYTVEIFGTELKRFRPKKTTEAEDIGWISCLYELAGDARPGVYYGKVTAKGKWNGRSFTTSQGFLFEITGEGTITLKGKLDGTQVEVSGPVSSFPEADKLELLVEALSQEEEEAVQEAVGSQEKLYTTFSLSLYANGETADTIGPVTVKVGNQTIKESTAPLTETQKAQAAAMAAAEEQSAEPQEETGKAETAPGSPEAGEAARAAEPVEDAEEDSTIQAVIQRGPGAEGKTAGRALLSADGSLADAKEEEDTEEAVIADSKAAELTLLKVDTRSIQAQELEAGVTESGVLQTATSELMAIYAVAPLADTQEDGEPEGQTEATIESFNALVAQIKKDLDEEDREDRERYRDRESLMDGIQEARAILEKLCGSEEELEALLNRDSVFQENYFWLENVEGGLDLVRTQFSERYDQFVARYAEVTDRETFPWDAESWMEFQRDLIFQPSGIMYELSIRWNECYVFTKTEYEGYRSALLDMEVKAALREAERQIEASDMAQEALLALELKDLLQKIADVDAFMSGQLKPEEIEDQAVKERAIELAERLAAVRAAVFLDWAGRLADDVKAEKYQGYSGYHGYSTAMKDVERLQDDAMLAYLDEETRAEVLAARETLEALRYQLSTAVTPEALKTYASFLEGYEKLIQEYEDPQEHEKWVWESTESTEGALERIAALQRLAKGLPTELYAKTGEQQARLEEILSEEAVREFERILGVLQEWCEKPKEEQDREAKAMEKLAADAEKLYQYMLWSVDQEALRERLALLAARNQSQAVEAFIKEAGEFVKELEAFEENFLDESGDLLTYRLLSRYERVQGFYDALDRAGSQLERVKEAKEKLDQAWSPVAKKYGAEIQAMQNGLYDFLESIYALQRYFEETKEQYEKELEEGKTPGYPWNLQLAYESRQQELERLLEADPGLEAATEFKKAAKILEGIGDWIKEHKESWPDLGEDPEAGTYVVGDEPWSADASIPQTTMENAEAFVQLIQAMESGLHEIGDNVSELMDIYQRVYELEGKIEELEGEDEIPVWEEIGSLEQEIARRIQEIDRVAKSTEYDNWHGLVGGDAYAVTAWEEEGIQNPMKIQLSSVTVKGLGLTELPQAAGPGEERRLLEAAAAKIWEERAKLDARQNISQSIAEAMSSWAEKEGATKAQGHDFDREIKEYTAIPVEGDAIEQSFINTKDVIDNIQTFEGVLNTQHDMLQRMNMLAVNRINMDPDMDPETQQRDIAAIEMELQAWEEGVTFLAGYVSYDGWHGLSKKGTIHVPMGWPVYLKEYGCDHVQIPISDMTAAGLGVDGIGSMGAEEAVQKIQTALQKISLQRSIFGAWQNNCEHIIALCEMRMDGISLVGNEFDRTVIHHIPLKLADGFDRVYTEMQDRIYELEVKKQNGVLAEVDIAAIDEEIHQLQIGMDVLIDLIWTEVEVTPYVRLEEGTEWGSLIRINTNDTDYRYKLTYRNLASNTTNVCLVDHIEDGDASIFAGVVRGVDLSEAKDKKIDLQVYVQTSRTAEEMPPTPEAQLPEALRQEGGGWCLIDPDTFTDWAYVTWIAFDLGDTRFGNIEGVDAVSSVSVEVLMSSIYGGKPGCEKDEVPAAGYELYNTCKVYQQVGDSERLEETQGAYTKVVIGYETEGLPLPIRLPDTGGPGLLQMNRFGWLLLLIAMMLAGTEVRYFGEHRRRVGAEELEQPHHRIERL